MVWGKIKRKSPDDAQPAQENWDTMPHKRICNIQSSNWGCGWAVSRPPRELLFTLYTLEPIMPGNRRRITITFIARIAVYKNVINKSRSFTCPFLPAAFLWLLHAYWSCPHIHTLSQCGNKTYFKQRENCYLSNFEKLHMKNWRHNLTFASGFTTNFVLTLSLYTPYVWGSIVTSGFNTGLSTTKILAGIANSVLKHRDWNLSLSQLSASFLSWRFPSCCLV